MQNLSDEELVRYFLSGREESFRVLFERHYKKVFSLSYRFCGMDSNMAEEATQETFLQVYKSLGRFQFKSSFYTWLYRVTFNTCSILVKKDTRIRLKPIEGLEDSLMAIDGREPQESLVRKEHQSLVSEVMRSLPEEHRQVMILGPLMGLSYQEISEVLGESVAVIKGRLFRARQKFKKNFERIYGGDNFLTLSATNQSENP
ncbi:MAG: RNA polymerase sigma factor [Candidatus Cloacimonetes bacterium]|nr:RNA polymerase sigma factor [Candidatus Cloacimonadota bacterium]